MSKCQICQCKDDESNFCNVNIDGNKSKMCQICVRRVMRFKMEEKQKEWSTAERCCGRPMDNNWCSRCGRGEEPKKII